MRPDAGNTVNTASHVLPALYCVGMDTQKLFTPAELDRILRYPRGRSARLARAGKLPAILLPDGEVRFSAGEIDRLITAQRDTSAEQGGNHAR